MNAGVIIFVLLLVLAFLGLPIYLSIGIQALVAMLHAGFPLEAVAQKTLPRYEFVLPAVHSPVHSGGQYYGTGHHSETD